MPSLTKNLGYQFNASHIAHQGAWLPFRKHAEQRTQKIASCQKYSILVSLLGRVFQGKGQLWRKGTSYNVGRCFD